MSRPVAFQGFARSESLVLRTILLRGSSAGSMKALRGSSSSGSGRSEWRACSCSKMAALMVSSIMADGSRLCSSKSSLRWLGGGDIAMRCT